MKRIRIIVEIINNFNFNFLSLTNENLNVIDKILSIIIIIIITKIYYTYYKLTKNFLNLGI